MRSKIPGSMIALAAMLFVAQTALAAGDDVADGHRYFVRYCASCHGTEGLGDGPVAKSLGHAAGKSAQCSATNMACRCLPIKLPN